MKHVVDISKKGANPTIATEKSTFKDVENREGENKESESIIKPPSCAKVRIDKKTINPIS